MSGFDKGRFACEGDLNGGGSPGNEIEGGLVANALEGLVNVRGIDVIALNDIEHGNVFSGFGIGRDHDIFGLSESSHDIEDGGFANADAVAFGEFQGCVARHEEVASWGRNKGGE